MRDPDDLLPVGLEDRLPALAEPMTRARRAALDALARHGYRRVRPPLIEFEASLSARMARTGGASDARAMFRFVDPESLRMLALRADITPQIGRIASSGLRDWPRPLRLAYCGDVARIRSDPLDPARERTQLGAELIGADSLEAASEVVACALEALGACAPRNVSIDFTLPDLVDTLAQTSFPLVPDKLEAVRRELDMKDAGALKALGAEQFLPLLYASGPLDQALGKLRAIDAGGALASRIDALEALGRRLEGKARLTLDPSERHGFEYQSWLGFTFYVEGVRGAAGRGGTYRIARSGEPACGFSLYLDTIAAAMAADEAPREVLYLPRGHDVGVAARLRAIGWTTIAQILDDEDPAALGCTHILKGKEPVAL